LFIIFLYNIIAGERSIVNIDPVLKEMAGIFLNAGKDLYVVGGAVRDLLRGGKAHDWDLATGALPEEVIALFRRVVPTGLKHGTVTVHYKGREFEITTFRAESSYSDGRRPDKVEFGVSIEKDLSRRDFTMNAIAYRLPAGPLIDPFGGQEDIKVGLIRCVGKAEERFAEDGLRPMRALRFVSQLAFRLDDAALAAIPGALSLTAGVAPERLRAEIDKIIASPLPSAALRLMEKTGLLSLLLPELAECRGIDQKGFHRFDVLDHSLLACDYGAREHYPQAVRMAALFHDLGKKVTRKAGADGVWTFYLHERESSRLARSIMLRFRYPNALTDQVCRLIEEHMFHYTGEWSDAAVRRFIIRAGEENLEDLYKLRMADTYATTGDEPNPNTLLPLMERVGKILASRKALSLRDLAVSGEDLKAEGVKPGRTMGIILRELLEAVIDDPELNSRERLLEIARRINGRYENP
jgi:tRNA nucleotidyltransferase/poly(A) polymerase